MFYLYVKYGEEILYLFFLLCLRSLKFTCDERYTINFAFLTFHYDITNLYDQYIGAWAKIFFVKYEFKLFTVSQWNQKLLKNYNTLYINCTIYYFAEVPVPVKGESCLLYCQGYMLCNYLYILYLLLSTASTFVQKAIFIVSIPNVFIIF